MRSPRELLIPPDLVAKTEDVSFLLGKLLLFFMMVLITANAVGRYLFDSPIAGVILLTEIYLMIGLIYLSLPLLQRREGNIAVEIVSKRFGDTTNMIIRIGYLILTIAFFLVVFWQVADAAWIRWQNGTTTGGLVTVPTSYSWGLLALGLGLFCVRLINQLVATVRELSIPSARRVLEDARERFRGLVR